MKEFRLNRVLKVAKKVATLGICYMLSFGIVVPVRAESAKADDKGSPGSVVADTATGVAKSKPADTPQQNPAPAPRLSPDEVAAQKAAADKRTREAKTAKPSHEGKGEGKGVVPPEAVAPPRPPQGSEYQVSFLCQDLLKDSPSYCTNTETSRKALAQKCHDSFSKNMQLARHYQRLAQKSKKERDRGIEKQIGKVSKADLATSAGDGDYYKPGSASGTGEGKRKGEGKRSAEGKTKLSAEGKRELEAAYAQLHEAGSSTEDYYERCFQHAMVAADEADHQLAYAMATGMKKRSYVDRCVKIMDQKIADLLAVDVNRFTFGERQNLRSLDKDAKDARKLADECKGDREEASGVMNWIKQNKNWLIGAGVVVGVIAALCFIAKIGPCKKKGGDSKSKKKKTKDERGKPPQRPVGTTGGSSGGGGTTGATTTTSGAETGGTTGNVTTTTTGAETGGTTGATTTTTGSSTTTTSSGGGTTGGGLPPNDFGGGRGGDFENRNESAPSSFESGRGSTELRSATPPGARENSGRGTQQR